MRYKRAVVSQKVSWAHKFRFLFLEGGSTVVSLSQHPLKKTSSTISSLLYDLCTAPPVCLIVGDEINFAHTANCFIGGVGVKRSEKVGALDAPLF